MRNNISKFYIKLLRFVNEYIKNLLLIGNYVLNRLRRIVYFD